MNKNIVLSVCIAIVLILSIGIYYYDEIGWGVDTNKPIQYPTSNNYDISPPEIKNYEDKLTDET